MCALFLDLSVSSKDTAHFIQKRSIRKKTLNWKMGLVCVCKFSLISRRFPLISRRFPLSSRRFPLMFWEKACQIMPNQGFRSFFVFKHMKRVNKMPRASKGDQMEDPGICVYTLWVYLESMTPLFWVMTNHFYRVLGETPGRTLDKNMCVCVCVCVCCFLRLPGTPYGRFFWVIRL